MLPFLLAAAAWQGAIDPGHLSNDIRILASDAFEGRGPGTAGEQKTVAYLTQQFAAAGTLPAGDHGGWTQAVEMSRHELSPNPLLQATVGRCKLGLGPEAVLWTRNAAPRVDLRNVPLVFAGHGVNAPEQDWNDYDGVNVRGKIVLVLPNDPDYRDDSGPFGGKRMTYYARLTSKIEEAGRRGAAAVLALYDSDAAEYPWPLLQQTYAAPANGIPGSDSDLVKFAGYVSEAASKRLFDCAGRQLSAEAASARRRGFRAFTLKGAKLTAAFDVKVTKTLTHNVVAKIPGKTHPDEYFAYTAHWDHLGRGKPDRTGDDIYNGALDNAGGTAGLLELARAFGRAPRPDRSILFIATTLEESGLLGSEYFATHPLVPLAKIAGGINMDAINLMGMTGTMEVTSMGQTTLEDDLQRALARQGRIMDDDPNSVVGFYYRSDHFPFAKRGVPFIFAGSGWELADKKVPNIREPEVGTRYHQPSDEWSPDLDFSAGARDVEAYYEVGEAIANSSKWPQWKPGAEFSAIREQSEAQRPR